MENLEITPQELHTLRELSARTVYTKDCLIMMQIITTIEQRGKKEAKPVEQKQEPVKPVPTVRVKPPAKKAKRK